MYVSNFRSFFSTGNQFFLFDFLVGTLVGGVGHGHGADFLGTSPLASTPNPYVDSDARRGRFMFFTLRGMSAGLVLRQSAEKGTLERQCASRSEYSPSGPFFPRPNTNIKAKKPS